MTPSSTGVSGRHPAISNRKQVVVGTLTEAYAWADRHDVPYAQIWCASGARALIGLAIDPIDTHLVLMPSYFDLPQHYLLRTEVTVLSRRGATVEWA